jgi:hypothetical protein
MVLFFSMVATRGCCAHTIEEDLHGVEGSGSIQPLKIAQHSLRGLTCLVLCAPAARHTCIPPCLAVTLGGQDEAPPQRIGVLRHHLC